MNEIDEIKNRIDIVDFIGKYVTLKKAGANYKAVCPFHNEKTPSMMVSPEKQIFKCFGCGEGGSVFDFLMKMENLDFGEALRILAEQTGVELKSTNKDSLPSRTGSSKDRLYALNRFTARFFHKVLATHPSGENALAYLKKRGIDKKTVEKYLIGYAPKQKILADYLRKFGYRDSEIKAAGNPAMFFNRIMFPIFDNLGHIVAFTGRVIDAGEPKYLNTPETVIFNKSRVLYGLNVARQAIKEKDFVILVEGQTDVIFSQNNGYENTVATSGTSLTEEHLKNLSRLTFNILLAYDQDSAGEKATKRAFELADQFGLNVKIIELPEGKDPADCIREDPKIWADAVAGAKRVIDYYLARSLASFSKPYDVEAKKKIAKEILPLIKLITDPIEQAHYIQLLASEIDTKVEAITTAIAQVAPAQSTQKVAAANPAGLENLTAEQTLIGLLAIFPDLLKMYIEIVEESFFTDADLKAVYFCLKKEYNNIKTSENFDILDYLKKDLSDKIRNKLSLILLTLEQRGDLDLESAKQEIEALLVRSKLKKHENILSEFAQKIAQAEQSGDRDLVRRLNKELSNAIKEN